MRDAFHPRDLAASVCSARCSPSVPAGSESIRPAAGRRTPCPWPSCTAGATHAWPASGSTWPTSPTALRYSVDGHGQSPGPSAISAGGRRRPLTVFCEEIAKHAEKHPDWLGTERPSEESPAGSLSKQLTTSLGIVIPARNEEGCIASTVEHLSIELRLHDRRRTKSSWWTTAARTPPGHMLQKLSEQHPELAAQCRTRASTASAAPSLLDSTTARATPIVIMMADESDDCRDVVRYWQAPQRRLGRCFRLALHARRRRHRLSRAQALAQPAREFVPAGALPRPLNDFTNAFKAYRRTVIDGCRPFLSPHFNLTVELPLKTIVRGYSWTVMPITWRNRRSGDFQAQDQGDGQPLSVHRAVLLAGEIFQPRRLSPEATRARRSKDLCSGAP